MKVKIASSIKYGGCSQFKSRAEKLERFIYDHINEIRCEFGRTFVKGCPLIVIRPCPRDVYGQYDMDNDIIEIDIRQNRSRKVLLNTLIHELVHARQFRQGRLNGNLKGFLWKGKLYTNEEEYEKWPWEIEANSVANAMVNIIIK